MFYVLPRHGAVYNVPGSATSIFINNIYLVYLTWYQVPQGTRPVPYQYRRQKGIDTIDSTIVHNTVKKVETNR